MSDNTFYFLRFINFWFIPFCPNRKSNCITTIYIVILTAFTVCSELFKVNFLLIESLSLLLIEYLFLLNHHN